MLKNFVQYENFIFLSGVQDSNWSGTIKILGQFFLLILLVIGILYVTYYFIKMTSNAKMPNRSGKNMEVIETLAVSYQNYIQIVRVCDEYFLINVGKESVMFLSKLDDPNINIDTTEHTNKLLDSFENYLKDFKEKNKNKDKGSN